MKNQAASASLLDEIAAHKKREVSEMKALVSPPEMAKRADRAAKARNFGDALRAAGFGVIAEIKRASPSAGTIRSNIDPAALARAYVRGGACALSVLTDRRFFHGSPDDLRLAREAVAVPVLRKDFILEPYQVDEARAMGADAVLLILGLLAQNELRGLIDRAEDRDMDALVEVHTKAEVDRALAAGARLIGINNRDLRTFDVSLETTERLRRLIPDGVLVVSESGITTFGDLARMRTLVDAVLVGTSLVASENPEEALRSLLSAD